MSEQQPRCIGADVGGTFTDVILSDGDQVWRAKAASTPGNLGRGVLDACRLVAEQAGTTLDDLLPTVTRFGLGTTAVTNVIASRAGRRVGLITTKGFEDLVPIARAMRTASDGWLLPPEPLLDREWIAGVTERIDRAGDVITKLEPGEVRDAARALVERHGVEALAVSFLWSCANDRHERSAVAEVRQAYPDLPVFSGAELLPVLREFDRTQFALLNAYTSGALGGVRELAEELARLGLPQPPLLVHSGGGSISVAEGQRVPATLAESGPAAGVVAALSLCQAIGVSDAVTGDVGGTSFDVAFLSGGEASRRSRGDLMGVWTALPMVDIDSVGAGGGSIAWMDALGILRVGPQSAGALPGPACYGRGGTDATVTDALVVLGYIAPDGFLGGSMHLDLTAATSACERLGASIGLDAAQAAWGIWEVAQASMARALRARFAERGSDPAEFTMISMGGAGALSSASIARELKLKEVIVPELASVFSAFGAAASDVRRERSRAIGVLLPMKESDLRGVAARITTDVRADLAADGVAPGDMTITLAAELRFYRQKYELGISWDASFDETGQQAQAQLFTAEYARRYGRGALAAGAPVELVTLRAVGLGRTVQARLASEPEGQPKAAPVAGQRPVLVDRDAAAVQVSVIKGADIRPGHTVTGPAVIDAADTTIWVPREATARMDSYRNIRLEF